LTNGRKKKKKTTMGLFKSIFQFCLKKKKKIAKIKTCIINYPLFIHY